MRRWFFAVLLITANGRLDAQVCDTAAPQVPTLPAMVASCGSSCPPTKTCVSQPKKNTKKVFACKVEEYCLPRRSLWSLLHHACGKDDCTCGELRLRHRLVVKTVNACDTRQCVPVPLPPPCTPGLQPSLSAGKR